MSLLATEAVVLHAFDYSETSRILRLATREAGLVSVIAKGARRGGKRFGSALDLFAQGTAQLHLREQRDLQTLGGFDITRSRPELAEDLGRFAGAEALAELVLRFGGGGAHERLFDVLTESLDALAAAAPPDAREAGLAGAWRLVAELGFAPSLERCSGCHAELDQEAELGFSHAAGGVLCAACARHHLASRGLPASARAAIAAWTAQARVPELGERQARAHQRLLREFLHEHLGDGRMLRAFDAWEHGSWVGA